MDWPFFYNAASPKNQAQQKKSARRGNFISHGGIILSGIQKVM
jgi:hypothetical protein